MTGVFLYRSRVSCFDAECCFFSPLYKCDFTLIYLGILYGIAVLNSWQFGCRWIISVQELEKESSDLPRWPVHLQSRARSHDLTCRVAATSKMTMHRGNIGWITPRARWECIGTIVQWLARWAPRHLDNMTLFNHVYAASPNFCCWNRGCLWMTDVLKVLGTELMRLWPNRKLGV